MGFGQIRQIDGRPAIRNIITGQEAPEWRGRRLELGFGADFHTRVLPEYFTDRVQDPAYVLAVCEQAIQHLIPDAMHQIHGRMRPGGPEAVPPDERIGVAYTTTENHALVDLPEDCDGRLMRPVFHRMMGTLKLFSEKDRRWDHLVSGAADRIAGLIALNAQAALSAHSGEEGCGPDVPTSLELATIDGEKILLNHRKNTCIRLPVAD